MLLRRIAKDSQNLHRNGVWGVWGYKSGLQNAAGVFNVDYAHGDERAQQPTRALLLAVVLFPVPGKALKQLLLKPHVEGHVRLRIPAKSQKEHVEQTVVRSPQRTTSPGQIQMLQAMMNEAVLKLAALLLREL